MSIIRFMEERYGDTKRFYSDPLLRDFVMGNNSQDEHLVEEIELLFDSTIAKSNNASFPVFLERSISAKTIG